MTSYLKYNCRCDLCEKFYRDVTRSYQRTYDGKKRALRIQHSTLPYLEDADDDEILAAPRSSGLSNYKWKDTRRGRYVPLPKPPEVYLSLERFLSISEFVPYDACRRGERKKNAKNEEIIKFGRRGFGVRE